MQEKMNETNKFTFEPIKLASINFANRIIRSATHEGYANDAGRPDEKLADLYEKLAKGKVGAIITGFCAVEPGGKAIKNMMTIDRDEWIGDYKTIVSRVHKYNTPIIMQLVHAGRQSSEKIVGGKTVSPSAMKDKVYRVVPHALLNNEIEQIIENFAQAVKRAKAAGFDGVQLHAAHGYLLSQFLSPYINRRNDEWGGSIEKRFRIMERIMEKSRQLVGDFPILVKMNAYDTRENGMRVDEAIEIARLLEKVGFDAIEVSCGIAEDGFNTVRVPEVPVPAILEMFDEFRNQPWPLKKIAGFFIPYFIETPKPLENYNVKAAANIKKNVNIPVIAVGGIRKISDIRQILMEKSADLVAMSRPFIIEPHIVKKFESGKSTESKCINCGYCLMGILQEPLRCYYGKIKK